jgi:hypothetical protein
MISAYSSTGPHQPGETGFSLYSMFVAINGAVVVLLAYHG